jgi:hypothetical protein
MSVGREVGVEGEKERKGKQGNEKEGDDTMVPKFPKTKK